MSTAEASVDETETLSEDDVQDRLVSSIIRHHAAYSAAGGLIPVPLLDIAASTTIQIRMIAQLCEAYDLPFSKQAVKSAVSALLASALPTATVGYPTISLAKGVPVVGPLLGVLTMPAYNAIITYAVGRVFSWHFARGGTLEDVDAKELSGRMAAEMKAGKEELTKSAGRSKKADSTATD
jgi:uncharacterized protein (DUF697 family)